LEEKRTWVVIHDAARHLHKLAIGARRTADRQLAAGDLFDFFTFFCVKFWKNGRPAGFDSIEESYQPLRPRPARNARPGTLASRGIPASPKIGSTGEGARMNRLIVGALVLLSLSVGLPAQGAHQAPGDTTHQLVFHGGSVLTSAHVVYIFWGPTFAPGGADHDYASSLQGFRNQFGTTPEYAVITQYTDSAMRNIMASSLAGQNADWFDTSPPPNDAYDALVQNKVRAYLASHTSDANAIYEVILPRNSFLEKGQTSCGGPTGTVQMCAYHASVVSGATPFRYAAVGYPSCSFCQPLGFLLTPAQNSEISVGHETREAMTDPDLNAWYEDGADQGTESDDRCRLSPPPFLVNQYAYQYSWSNELNGCAATRWVAQNAASYELVVAPDSIAVLFGQNLASVTTSAAGNPLPTNLGGVSVTVAGLSAGLSYVSPSQINFVLPSSVMPVQVGMVNVSNNGTLAATGTATVQQLAPALFSANATGNGTASGFWLRYNGVGQLIASSNSLAVPIDFGNPTDQVYLVLYGTGIRHRSSLDAVNVTVDGYTYGGPMGNGGVTYAGPDGGGSAGLDQVNVHLFNRIAGPRSGVAVTLSADGQTPQNKVTIDVH
jgi:uncharacterized protein (TIGR03437 family)